MPDWCWIGAGLVLDQCRLYENGLFSFSLNGIAWARLVSLVMGGEVMHGNDDTDGGRRRFLLGLSAVGGLTAAGSAFPARDGLLVPEVQGQPERDASQGYRETEHVRAYYRTLKD